jgi:hypothetical protein
LKASLPYFRLIKNVINFRSLRNRGYFFSNLGYHHIIYEKISQVRKPSLEEMMNYINNTMDAESEKNFHRWKLWFGFSEQLVEPAKSEFEIFYYRPKKVGVVTRSPTIPVIPNYS